MKNIFFICFLFLLPFVSKGQSAYSKLCLEGVGLEAKNDLVTAKVKYSQAIGIKPEEYRAYLFRGKVSFRLEEYDEAIADMTLVIQLDPKNKDAFNVRSRAYMKKKEWEQAIADQSILLEKLSKKDSLYNRTLLRRANAYYEAKNYNSSINDLTTLINGDLLASRTVPATYYQKRGEAYVRAEKYAEAITDLQIVAAKYPNDRSVLYLLGLSYYRKGDLDNAKKTGVKLLEIDPIKKHIYDRENILEVFKYQANKEAYTSDYIELQDRLKEVRSIPSLNLKNIELKEMYEKGKGIWDRLVLPFSEDLELRDSLKNTLKTIYAGLSEKPAINEEARKLVVQANNATEEKRYDEAIFLYLKSLSMEPCNHLAYYNLGLLYAQKNWYAPAITQLEEYLKVYPDAPDKRAAQDLIYEWEGKVKTQSASTYVDPELKNSMKVDSADQIFFIASYGFVKPLDNTAMFNASESIEDRFFKSGKLGLQNGFYIEAGGGGGSFSNSERIGVSLEILLRYRQHAFDWKTAGGIFSNYNNYTKDFRFLEFSEKIGMWIRPAQHTFVHLYYAPALVMQFESEFREETDTYAQFYQIGGDKPRISHTLGASLRYRFLALSYEWDYVPFKFDIRSYYNDKLTGIITDETVSGKTKSKFGTVRISLYL